MDEIRWLANNFGTYFYASVALVFLVFAYKIYKSLK